MEIEAKKFKITMKSDLPEVEIIFQAMSNSICLHVSGPLGGHSTELTEEHKKAIIQLLSL